jgi:Clp amino terminal domain, pathogenicity island component/NTF2 fold immunity protein
LYYHAKKAEDDQMFERFTQRARRVIFFARYDASQFGSTSIETEHMLLGILREDPNVISRFTSDPSASKRIGAEVSARLPVREKVGTSSDLPLSPECKRIFPNAADEAKKLEHWRIGVEHLLLGILREEKSVASQVLAVHGLELNKVREQLLRSPDPTDEPRGDLSHQLQSLLFRFNDAALPTGGAVPDAETAMRIAEAVWIPQYGMEMVASQKPIQAERKLTMWIVTGSAAPEAALFAFILCHDGRVVSVGRGDQGA